MFWCENKMFGVENMALHINTVLTKPDDIGSVTEPNW